MVFVSYGSYIYIFISLYIHIVPAWGLSALRAPLHKMCKFERSQNTKIYKMLAKLRKFGRSLKKQKDVKRDRGSRNPKM